MSLPAIAKQLEAKGRNGDSKLIHVTDAELKGLHAIAAAHGKKITINPETGLPEAFSLGSLLPTVIGAGLTLMGVPPMIAAGVTGVGYGAATGSLQKGLMAGLGAYGGAGLTEGLMGGEAMAGGLPGGGAGGAAPPAVPAVSTPPAPDVVAAMRGNEVQALQGIGGPNPAQFANSPVLTADQAQALGMQPTISTSLPTSTAIANTPAPSMLDTAGANWDKASAGVNKLYEGGWEPTKAFLGANKMNLAMAAAPVVTDALTPAPAGPGTPVDKGTIRPYSFDYNRTNAEAQNVSPIFDGSTTSSAEKTYFAPTYTAKDTFPAANGGIVGMAMGGQVENNAAIKAVGMNTDFPMAHLDTPIYANPQVQRPDAKEVVNPSGDVSVDMFTGEPRLASGGIASYGLGGTISGVAYPSGGSGSGAKTDYAYDPKTQQFTETTTTPPPQQQQQMGGFGFPFGMLGVGSGIMSGGVLGGGSFGGGGGMVNPYVLQAIASNPAPTTTTKTSGGIMDPYVPPSEQGMANGGTVKMADGGWSSMFADLKAKNDAYDPNGPAYKYDPTTQTYTQLRDPTGGNLPFPERTPQEMVNSYGPFAMVPYFVNAIAGKVNETKDRYNYLKNGPKTVGGGVQTPKVIGGIAEPAVVTPEQQSSYVTPTQRLGLTDFYTTTNNALDRFGQQFNPPPPKEEEVEQKAVGGMAGNGYHLGGYSDGGRLLKGPGDGVSDSIPATIGDRQPARLADGEFVIPARIVSELGNGSTEAGARKLYAMMDRVQKQRSKTVGKGKVAVNSRADKHLPA